MAEEVQVEKKAEEDWMTKKWRPMMAMMYMICCLCDFALFPIMFTIVQFWEVQAANDAFRQWVPITLQGGGLFHVAMGGVLGVSAYGRTQEKVAGATTVSTGVPTPTLPGTPAPAPVVNNTPAPVAPTPIYTQQTTTTYMQQPAVTVGFNGKAAPPPAPQPLI